MVNQKKICFCALLRALCEMCEKKGKYQVFHDNAEFFRYVQDSQFYLNEIGELDKSIKEVFDRLLERICE